MRRFLSEPYPIAGLAVEEVVARVAAALGERGDVAAAFLFGSQASGEADALSDFDFAVLPDPGTGDLDLRSTISRVLRTEDVGILNLDGAEAKWLQVVASTGRPIYERSPGAAQTVLAHRQPDRTAEEQARYRLDDILHHLAECVEELDAFLAEGREAAESSRRNRWALDRALEMVAQDVIDYARHLGRLRGWEAPDDPQHADELLAHHGELPWDAAALLRGLPGLRVLLAHEYRHVDRERLWADLTAGIEALHRLLARFEGRK